ncbi:MAG TPA: RNA-directed DNA polymerase, partial [Thermoanaerobaculia bacterium]|nr:RNA-directed DNA polymerase [Thermoanaerobaculia bacterium]
MQVDLDELTLAWKRYQRDLTNRCFVDHPLMTAWIESNLERWLTDISDHLAQGYHAQPARRCSVPKPGFMIRPGTVLEAEDAVVYNCLVGRAYPNIHADVTPTEETLDIAYRTTDDSDSIEWTKHDFTIWREWRQKSIAALKRGVTQVVTTDITGFYDNIPIQKVVGDLRRIGVEEDVLTLLQECLRKWSFPRDEGIPQGYSASDLLAKLYLATLDRKLRRDGYVHLRYVDDIRVFCAAKLDAKKAIWDISKHL